VDFLLECIGFPPGQDLAELARVATHRAERVALRGAPGGEHLRVALGSGLELRMDREAGQERWTLLPYFEPARRLRVAVTSLASPPDSPDDALLMGRANPPPRSVPEAPAPDAYDLAALLTDARRLPRDLQAGHVLAVALAGFALDVSHVGDAPSGRVRCAVAPLRGPHEPGGCVEVALRVRRVQTERNPLTAAPVELLELETPGRTLPFFLSPWQLAGDGLPMPRAGCWIEGTFLLTGRVAGGLGAQSERLGRSFG
jgi:hypothetical protein